MVRLYYYTSAEECRGILVDGVIRRSRTTARGAMLGQGVYLTEVPPETSDMKLLTNNWDGGSETAILSKLDNLHYYIEFDSEHLPGAEKLSPIREVWKVPHDIVLKDVKAKIFVREHNIAVAQSHGYL
jgi:hypothetical protein